MLLLLCILAVHLTEVIRVLADDSTGTGETVLLTEETEAEEKQEEIKDDSTVNDSTEEVPTESVSAGDDLTDVGNVKDSESDGKADSTETDSTETDSGEIGSEEIGSTEMGSEEIDSTETGSEEIDSTEIGSEEVDFKKNGMLQIGVETVDGTDPYADGNTRSVYFDATLSKLSYTGDAGGGLGLPADGADLWCHVWVSSDITQNADYKMTLSPKTVDGTTWNDVYIAEIDKKYDQILFYSGSVLNPTTPGTDDLVIPEESAFTAPCFYADAGDVIVYGSSKYRRSGYWGEAYAIHNAQQGKGTDVVDIAEGSFNREFQTYYARAALYDYYTDYELNGSNRDSYPADASEVNSHRIYQPFRQFNQALSEYYRAANAVSPLYWGNFQNYGGVNANHFNEIQGTLNLYGYSDNGSTDAYKKFFYENNSMWGRDGVELGSGGNATQNLTASSLQDGVLMLKTQDGSEIKAPFFDEEFLLGKNAKNTVLGEVYSGIAFPFIQQATGGLKKLDGSDAGGTVDYWYFNSKDNSASATNRNLTLKWDGTLGLHYLESSSDVVHGTTTIGATAEGNYFPLNGSGQSANAGKLNYGFGQKLEIDFRMTEDGAVSTTTGDRVPIQFDFRGDDDVWVFIDGQLVLDVGGGHGIVNGVIDFAHKQSTVSSVKNNTGGGTTSNVTKDLSGIMNDEFYRTEHKLTMFYMERGLWESNLYITFNFPDESLFSVEKEVNTEEVNELFDGLFEDTEFTFNIKNQATHYPAHGVGAAGGFVINQEDIPGYGSVDTGKLENAAGATYSIPGRTGTVDGAGNFKLKDKETAVFSNQFRRGSYLYLEEDADAEVFRTTWEFYDGGEKISTTVVPARSQYALGGKVLTAENTKGTTVSDGRQEVYVTDDEMGITGIQNSGYTQTGPAHISVGATTDQTLVFRSFKDPDSTIGLDLKVKEINTVRTGAITVKKEKTDESEALGEKEFSFTVRFTNVAGMNLEGSTSKELTFQLKSGEEEKIEGIPAGTAYTISEAATEGYTLENVDVKSGNDTEIEVGTTAVNGNETVDVSGKGNVSVTGVVTADDDAADLQETVFTFENEKTAGSIDIVKQDASGNIEGVEFTLFQKDGNVAKDVDGKELKGITASDGTLSFSRIPVGTRAQPVTYYLRETKSKPGYALMKEQIEVKLPYEYHAGDVVNGTPVTEDGVTWHLSFTIINDRVFTLPKAGQTGIGDFTFWGVLFLGVAGGAFCLLLQSRRAAVVPKSVSSRSGWLPKGISYQPEEDDRQKKNRIK